MFTAVATQMLRDAGYKVTPADMVPGLWDVEGLARDVTTAQLHQLAKQHGFAQIMPVGSPALRIDVV